MRPTLISDATLDASYGGASSADDPVDYGHYEAEYRTPPYGHPRHRRPSSDMDERACMRALAAARCQPGGCCVSIWRPGRAAPTRCCTRMT